MYRFWASIIEPILELIQPASIVEIGCDQGKNTLNLLEFGKQRDTTLYAIDPMPKFDVTAWREQYGDQFIFFKSLSLNAIPKINRIDVMLIDGDHNWYTVFNELILIDKRCKELKQPFPLIMFHDIGWPYGRRDLYYNPENIPDIYRKPYKKDGIEPGKPELVKDSGFNNGMKHSIYEGGLNNGVLTAIEDFIKQTDNKFEFIKIPGMHGLGILYPCKYEEKNIQFKVLINELKLSNVAYRYLKDFENARLSTEIFLSNMLKNQKKEYLEQSIKNEQNLSYIRQQLLDKEQDLLNQKSQNRKLDSELSRIKHEIENLKALHFELGELKKKNENMSVVTNKQVNYISQIELLFEKMYSSIKQLTQTNRWKIGCTIVDFKQRIFRRPKTPMATEYIYGLYDTFLALKKSRKEISRDKNTTLSMKQLSIKKIEDKDIQKKAIKTLVVSHNLKPQGAPNSLFDLTIGLKKQGVIDPIVYSPSDGPLRRVYESNGVKVIICNSPLSGVRSLEEYSNSISNFANYIKPYDIEFIYANTLQTFFAIELAKYLGLPCIWNPRESEPCETYFNYLPENIRDKAYECFSYASHIIFVSKASHDVWLQFNLKNNFSVIYNSLNPLRILQSGNNWTRDEARVALGVSTSEVVFLQVGTICERKGQYDLLLACSNISEELSQNMRVFLLGDKPSEYSSNLHLFIEKLPTYLKNRIKLVPEVDDFSQVVDYYLAADVFVFTSRMESYPRVILEAMAFDLPIITTPVFGVKEQVVQDVNALFYEPGDIAVLEDLIIEMLKDKEKRNFLANNCKLLYERLQTYDEMISKYANFIRLAYLEKNKN